MRCLTMRLKMMDLRIHAASLTRKMINPQVTLFMIATTKLLPDSLTIFKLGVF